ncbi:MAG TPA: prolyl oligopeptidase family serine peptidase [Terriglobales bacterium]|nr:prolyl oligopeptidase family serine peptidase [Terriglobales bacterium]
MKHCYALLALLCLTAAPLAAQESGPPPSRRNDVVDVMHGVSIHDPYRWLEDQNSPETRAWINAQNVYSRSVLGKLAGREQISRRLGELMKVDNIQTPIERNGRYFFRRRGAEQDLFVIYLRQGAAGKDEVLVDPHPMSADHSVSVDIRGVSPDGSLLAYGIRRGGADEIEVHLLDVNTHKQLPDVLPTARYFQVSFLPDKSGFYYSTMDNNAPRVRFHKLGTDPARDPEIFGKDYGPTNIILAQVTEDGRYLLLHVLYGAAADKTEVFCQDLVHKGPIKPVIQGINARFFASPGDDHLYVWTNWKAENGRVLDIDLLHPGQDHWREVVPQASDVIDDFAAYGGKLLVKYLHDVSSQIRVFQPDGKAAGEITFPSLGTVSSISGHWRGREAFFDFSSFHVPPTIYSYDLASGNRSQWARDNVPLESSRFELKQVWYRSKDGTKVPMFLLYQKGLKLNGANPVLMTAYGGFDISMTPRFSPAAVVWVEHGGIFALPNLRGGSEFGEQWHHAGMLEKKQNVFDDFFAAAEWLIQNHYTNPSRLAIEGRSNGGLLMGAAMTQRPKLYRAIICGYPLLDMLRYQKFLVARFWIPEYGSADNAGQFKFLYAYSPYQHVTKGTKYPAVLFETGDSDTRVAPLHARKMTALMQWANASGRPILLHYDTTEGHSEGRPVGKQIEDNTDELSFLFWQLGVKS